MRILLIGKYGQIASAFQEVKSSTKMYSFSKTELDVNNTKLVEEKIIQIKPNVVINTSAYIIISDCEIKPEKAFQTNTIAVRNLAILCKKYNVKLVTFSTDYVFDGIERKPYRENSTPNPLQIYGISKLSGEKAALNYYNNTYIIRTAGVFGGIMGSSIKKSNFVLEIIKQAKEKPYVEVSSENISSYTYAKDLAKATLQLIKRSTPGIYHLVNEGSCNWSQFAQAILEKAGIEKQIKKHKKKIKENYLRPKYSVLKNENAKNKGIVLPNWENALKRYVKDELQY